MPYSTKLTSSTVLFAALCVSPAAFAQDNATVDLTHDQATTFWVSADMDEDGALNADEFKDYTIAIADAGDVDARSLILSGQYTERFTELDQNEDNFLSPEEVMLEPVDEMDSSQELGVDIESES